MPPSPDTAASAPPDPPPAASTAGITRVERQAAKRAQRRRRRHRRVIGASIVVASLLVLAVGAQVAYLWYQAHRIHHVAVHGLSRVQSSGSQKDVENILLIGSTTRCGLDGRQTRAFGTCEQASGVNSDVVMILHLDPDHHRAALLSIPRDTFVPNARLSGSNKIDAALGDPANPYPGPNHDDPTQLVNAIDEDFGIPVTHYVELNFDSFQGVVEALGGLQMYFPMPVYDAESALNEQSGCQVLNGFQALAVVRARHLQYQPPNLASDPYHSGWPYDPQSDLSRIRRDHEFLRVLAAAVAHRGLANPITDDQLVSSVAPYLTTDSGFSLREMVNLVLTWHRTDPRSVPTYTLPVSEDGSPNGYFYGGSGYGDVVFPVQPDDAQVIAKFLGTAPGQSTTGHALPTPSQVVVAVENGTGQGTEGARSAQALQGLGFPVGEVADTVKRASTTETVVLYGDPSKLDDALLVQSELQGLVVVAYDPGIVPGTGTRAGTASTGSTGGSGSTGSLPVVVTAPGVRGVNVGFASRRIDVGTPIDTPADVVVVTGTNFAFNAPSASQGATTQAGAPTSAPTTSSTSPRTVPTVAAPAAPAASPLASNPELTAPSNPVESLAPWDPRSCGPRGGPGP